MYLYSILLVLVLVCIFTTHDPKNLKLLKEKYERFLKVLPKKYDILQRRTVITGLGPQWGELGYNINKGYEICICMDNDVNAMFHVLIHELAHGTVHEYKHNDNFWANFRELKEIAIANGLYIPIPEAVPFCGKKIAD